MAALRVLEEAPLDQLQRVEVLKEPLQAGHARLRTLFDCRLPEVVKLTDLLDIISRFFAVVCPNEVPEAHAEVHVIVCLLQVQVDEQVNCFLLVLFEKSLLVRTGLAAKRAH